jgi:lipopolysaccharide transport system ATP-binding protein
MSDPVVIVTGLGKRYSINDAGKSSYSSLRRLLNNFNPKGTSDQKTHHWALRDVSFTVHRGDRIGIIGSNGAGKSTLLKIMSRVVYPTTGEVCIRGALTSLLEVGTGFNDNLSGRENVFLNAALYGMSHNEIERKFDEIVAFSEVGRFIDTPVKHYSSGMRMRLAFAVAAHLDPDILLLDEVLAVGDMSFQRKCLERVDDLTGEGRTLFFVSHSMDSIIRYCNRCIWLDDGALRMDGDVEEVISAYVENVLNVRAEVGGGTVEVIDDAVVRSDGAPQLAVEANAKANTDEIQVGDLSVDARLVSARVVDSSGKKKSLFAVNETIGIEMVYDANAPGFYLPSVHVYCPQGTLLFAATHPDTNLASFRKERPVQVRVAAWLPPHLFNIGTYSVSLIVFSPMESPFKRYFNHEQSLSFHVVEAPIGIRSARGLMPRGFPGPIRPMLEWEMSDVAQ